MSRTRKVKRTNRRRTNRVKRSRVKRYKRTKRKSRMKRGGYPGKELINRLRSNNSITVGDKIYTSGSQPNKLIRNMDGRPGTHVNSLREVDGRGRYKVIGTQKEGKFGRKQKYLLLEGKLKILEKNAVKYNAVVIPPGPTGPLLERGAGSGTRMHMDGI